jgi:hypothetical protein
MNSIKYTLYTLVILSFMILGNSLNKPGYSLQNSPTGIFANSYKSGIFVIHNSHGVCVQYLRSTSITTTLVEYISGTSLNSLSLLEGMYVGINISRVLNFKNFLKILAIIGPHLL